VPSSGRHPNRSPGSGRGRLSTPRGDLTAVAGDLPRVANADRQKATLTITYNFCSVEIYKTAPASAAVVSVRHDTENRVCPAAVGYCLACRSALPIASKPSSSPENPDRMSIGRRGNCKLAIWETSSTQQTSCRGHEHVCRHA